MSNSPGLFIDIGSKAIDLLYKDYAQQLPFHLRYENFDYCLDLACQVEEIVPGLHTVFGFIIPDSGKLVLRKSLANGGLARGLHEGAKIIEKHAALLCVLAEDCNQPDYVKLVKGLCADHNVSLISVPSAKTLGEWSGLCKIDSEGNARKVVGCSCVVVKDYGEEHAGISIVQEYVKAH